MNHKVALLLGASGSVGYEVLEALLKSSAYKKVIIFVRKPLNIDSVEQKEKLVQKAIPGMNPSSLIQSVTEALNEYTDSEIMAFSALGIGANTAKLTIDQHRAIDVELNQAFAQALKKSPKVKSLSLLSAIGANPNAKTTGSGAAGMPRYARVKGEAEEAVKKHGPKVVHIFRPATILGSQHTPKILAAIAPAFDFIIPKKYHSISTEQIAEAMVTASLTQSSASKIFEYPEMSKLFQ